MISKFIPWRAHAGLASSGRARLTPGLAVSLVPLPLCHLGKRAQRPHRSTSQHSQESALLWGGGQKPVVWSITMPHALKEI